MKVSSFFSLISLSLVVFAAGCSKNNVAETSGEVDFELQSRSDDHKWYYFSASGFNETALPQDAALISIQPWTESLRVCDANTSSDGKGYVLVNHLGALVFDESDVPNFIKDYQLFSDSTSSDLVFSNGDAFFTLSRNSFFNKSHEPVGALSRPYLVRISSESHMFYPVVNYGDLDISPDSEISGMFYDGDSFLASVKTETKDRIVFNYIQWNPVGKLSELPPQTKQGKVLVTESSEGAYRKANTPIEYTFAPDRLQSLLKSLPKNFSFAVVAKHAGGASPAYYLNGSPSDATSSNAVIADGWACAVFADGTTYFNGALDGRHILNNGKNIAFRLPKLPENYFYGDFCIAGDFLVVSWEEKDFFRTGRSGFLTVDMKKLFYPESRE
ncbi:MAG: hypothetical protein II921_08480 [Treponema sp.]|nr:hypothetical protein [Treponema sp.]